MLFRIVHDLSTRFGVEADAFLVYLIRSRKKAVVPAKLNCSDNIGLSAISIRSNGDGFITSINLIPIPAVKHVKHISFEIIVCVCRIVMRCLEGRLLLGGQLRKIMLKTVLQSDYNIDIALAVDVCVIAVRPLKKYFKVLP
ncbi:MAG: hypothetical protein NPIRA05_03500 [Nitrospirales bacterium]|nr:MAG: hypothetical protein NPIRA05_03500 [Nitrospirales bacterium]